MAAVTSSNGIQFTPTAKTFGYFATVRAATANGVPSGKCVEFFKEKLT